MLFGNIHMQIVGYFMLITDIKYLIMSTNQRFGQVQTPFVFVCDHLCIGFVNRELLDHVRLG